MEHAVSLVFVQLYARIIVLSTRMMGYFIGRCNGLQVENLIVAINGNTAGFKKETATHVSATNVANPPVLAD